MDRNILIVIPAYNEELTIGSVAALSKKYGDALEQKSEDCLCSKIMEV